MIDEAQNLSTEALEQVRLLTNLETTREKLLQIILVGQPELRSLLGRVELRQLSQRITARYHLEPISRSETAAYIRHRLQVCGAAEAIFNERAIDLVHQLSCGVPRLINVLCDRAMLGAFVEGKVAIDGPIVRKAAREVLPEEGRGAPAGRVWRWGAVVVALGVLGATAYQLWDRSADWSRLLMLSAARPPVAASDTPAPTLPVPPDEPDSPDPHPPATPPREPMVDAFDADTLPDTENLSVATLPPPAAVATATASGGLAQALTLAGPRAAPNAWAGLYRLWGVQAEVMGDAQACAQAPGVGLRCLQGSGSWTMVTQFDRPAILLLVSDGGRRVPVLLHESLGSTVRVQVDGRELEVSVEELTRDWLGQYQILWKTPPQGSAVLRPGDRGSDVAWLREQMQRATGLTSIAPTASFFDDGLKELVQEFQRDQGLQDDGVAGPRTLIYLNNQERPATGPRLGMVDD
jgi:general secretion pathway protein A